MVRSGPDGADLALLEVLGEYDLRERFEAVVVASGDGIFSHAVAGVGGLSLATLVVARPESLARTLQLAAGSRVLALDPNGWPTEPTSAVALAEAA